MSDPSVLPFSLLLRAPRRVLLGFHGRQDYGLSLGRVHQRLVRLGRHGVGGVWVLGQEKGRSLVVGQLHSWQADGVD